MIHLFYSVLYWGFLRFHRAGGILHLMERSLPAGSAPGCLPRGMWISWRTMAALIRIETWRQGTGGPFSRWLQPKNEEMPKSSQSHVFQYVSILKHGFQYGAIVKYKSSVAEIRDWGFWSESSDPSPFKQLWAIRIFFGVNPASRDSPKMEFTCLRTVHCSCFSSGQLCREGVEMDGYGGGKMW